MLRITVQYANTHVTLKLEGKLTGPWVRELEHCWLSLAATAPNKPVHVELDDVDFIASEGQELITRMAKTGVELLASRPMVKAIVDEIPSRTSHTLRRRTG